MHGRHFLLAPQYFLGLPMKNIQRFLPVILTLILLDYYMMRSDASGGVSAGDTEWMTVFVTMFVALLLEAIPFVLLGAVISGTIEVLIPSETLASWIPRRRIPAVLLSGLAGFVFPICECGIVPVLRRLLRKGVPIHCGVTYLLAAPIVQPLVLISTYLAFGRNWRMVALRLAGGYLIAVTVGLLSGIFLDSSDFNIPLDDSEACEDCGHSHSHSHAHSHSHDHAHVAHAHVLSHHGEEWRARGDSHEHRAGTQVFDPAETLSLPLAVSPMRRRMDTLMDILEHSSEDFLSASSYLILGAFLAAAMQTFVGQSMLSRLGHGAILSTLVMMLLAFVLSLCSQADAFVAASFVQFPLASRIGFLTFGPTVDIKLIAMYQGFFSRKATLFIFGSVTTLVFLYALALHGLGL
jgi:uncharacterized membrane protein YraQ (UPF0718 family)